MATRALVIGASGFVGNHLLRHLLECQDSVAATILPGSSLDPDLEGRVECEELDITDAKKTSSAISGLRPEVIYHLAGISFVPQAENDFESALRINVGGTHNVFRIAHLLSKTITLVYVSSAEVYGKIKSEELPLGESVAIRPANNYSLTKAMAELVAQRYARLGALKAVVMRPFNHIGPGQSHQFVASSFAYQLALIGCGKAEPRLRVGNLDVKRDFSDVRDIVRAYRLAALHGSGTYNLGSGHATAIRTILSTLVEVSGLSVSVEQDPDLMRPAEVPEIYGDIKSAKDNLNWQPEIKLEDTLRDLYEYWVGVVKNKK